MQAQEYLRVTSDFQGKTLNRVTSGLRIVSSGDDAAGLAIANGFRSDQAVLSQGVRNANDGLSTLQTIDGGMSNISKLLDRARTLASQSASGTFTGDRSVLNNEFKSVLSEIDRQARAVGLDTGGQFAKSLSVFVGGGRAHSGEDSSAAITNGSIGVDLTTSTVDARSLGLQGMQAKGSGVDLSDAKVTSILADTNNTGSEKTTGYTDFFFSGSGFSGNSKVKVSVNLAGVTNADTLSSAINSAIASAGNGASAAATAFKNSGVSASVVTESDGSKRLAFTSSNTAFEVQAGDRMANAFLGNISTNSGNDLTNTVTGGAAVAGAGTPYSAGAAATIIVRIQGSALSSPVDVKVDVTTATTTANLLSSLSSKVASDANLQAAGISLTTATPGSALVFTSSRGEKFTVSSAGDTLNALGLGSYQASAATSGNFDYSTFTGVAAAAAGASQVVEFSIGGGAKKALTIDTTGAGSAAANGTLGAQLLNDAFAKNSEFANAGMKATDNGAGVITIASTNGTNFRINTLVAGTNVLGLGNTGVAAAANAQGGANSAGTLIAGGVAQSGQLDFTAIRTGGDRQTVTIDAPDGGGTLHSIGVTLNNSNANSIDEAISTINSTIAAKSDSTLSKIVAVKENVSGTDKIRFISSLNSFKVTAGTNASGAAGITTSQGTTLSSTTAAGGATADISTAQNAANAVTALSNAVSSLGTAQATVGKGQNNLTYAVNLAQSQLSNLAAAESRIRDADLANEAANMTKAQVLLQAGVAALAQANSAPQQILSLLRG